MFELEPVLFFERTPVHQMILLWAKRHGYKPEELCLVLREYDEYYRGRSICALLTAPVSFVLYALALLTFGAFGEFWFSSLMFQLMVGLVLAGILVVGMYLYGVGSRLQEKYSAGRDAFACLQQLQHSFDIDVCKTSSKEVWRVVVMRLRQLYDKAKQLETQKEGREAFEARNAFLVARMSAGFFFDPETLPGKELVPELRIAS